MGSENDGRQFAREARKRIRRPQQPGFEYQVYTPEFAAMFNPFARLVPDHTLVASLVVRRRHVEKLRHGRPHQDRGFAVPRFTPAQIQILDQIPSPPDPWENAYKKMSRIQRRLVDRALNAFLDLDRERKEVYPDDVISRLVSGKTIADLRASTQPGAGFDTLRKLFAKPLSV